eukprot:scaffold204598_cov19-Tisochrysis_lutea.AAC.1
MPGLQHPHIVRLLGYTAEGPGESSVPSKDGEGIQVRQCKRAVWLVQPRLFSGALLTFGLALVYELMARGSLDEHLASKIHFCGCCIAWPAIPGPFLSSRKSASSQRLSPLTMREIFCTLKCSSAPCSQHNSSIPEKLDAYLPQVLYGTCRAGGLQGFTYRSRQSKRMTAGLRPTGCIPSSSVVRHVQNTATSLGWLTRIKIAAQTACALAYLHSNGIIHRDIK